MNQFLTLKNEQEIVRVNLDDVLFFYVEKKMLTCKTENGEVFKCSQSLTWIETKVPEDFLKINRNVMINLFKMKRLERASRKLILLDGTAFKVSERRFSKLVKSIVSI